MEDAESENHEEDIQKPWESLISEKQLVTEFTKGQLVPTSSGLAGLNLTLESIVLFLPKHVLL